MYFGPTAKRVFTFYVSVTWSESERQRERTNRSFRPAARTSRVCVLYTRSRASKKGNVNNQLDANGFWKPINYVRVCACSHSE